MSGGGGVSLEKHSEGEARRGLSLILAPTADMSENVSERDKEAISWRFSSAGGPAQPPSGALDGER